MTTVKAPKEITVEELTLFIKFSRLSKKLGIALIPENLEDISLEVISKSSTEDLLAMISDQRGILSDYRVITGGPSMEMIENVVAELKTRGAI